MKKSFTLIELMMTIAIVSVISITLFMSINKWIANSRDANRHTAVLQVQKSLEIGYLENANYPIPDRDKQNRIYIGSINDKQLFYQGVVDKGVMQNLSSMDKPPMDPIDKEQKIVYSISADQQHYQLAMTEEKPKIANNQHQALLAGNYDCYLFYETGSETYVTNPPSLIYNYDGYNNSQHEITDEKLYFITDEEKNLPYPIDEENINNIETNEIFSNGQCDGPNITTANINETDMIGNKLIREINQKGLIKDSLNLIKTIKYYSKINDVLGNFNENLKYGDKFGSSVTNIGDLDGDGIQDIAVGTYSKNYLLTNDGLVYIIFLNKEGEVKNFQRISLPDELDAEDMFGVSIASIGDINNDGTTDIIAGAPNDDDGGENKGAAYILFLNSDGTLKSYKKISDFTTNFTSQLDEGDKFGISVSGLTDLDSDGINEIAIGSTDDDDGGSNHGAIYIIFPDQDGNIKKFQKISELEGNFNEELFPGDRFGNSVASIGDINNDGIGDIGIGAYTCNDGGLDKGCVYLLHLDENAMVKDYSTISDTNGNFSGILSGYDMFGTSITGVGDLNNDGNLDIAIGAVGDDEDANDGGTIYLLFLNEDGSVKEYKKIGNKQGNLNSRIEERDYFGFTLENLGDLDGDGLIELGVGSIGDDDGGLNHGSVYVLFLEL